MKFEKILLFLYFLVFAICAISPYDRTVWFAENLPMFFLIGTIVIISKYHKFSKLSYACMFILPILHTIGGHYTFERVPFEFITELFNFKRNHYDRIAHFSVGFYAYPIAEILLSKSLIANRYLSATCAITAIFTVASLYEIIEWLYAIYADSESGLAVLGSQGDIWDAQKDMLADGLGAILIITIFLIYNKNKDFIENKG